MTTADLIARFRLIVGYDLDSVLGPIPDPSDAVGNATFDAGIVGYLNEATLVIGKAAYLTNPAVVLTYAAGTNRYALDGPAFSSRVIVPYSVVLGGYRLRNAAGNDYGIWTTNELNMWRPTWMTDAPDQPTKVAVVGNSLLLHPTPDADGVAYVDAQVAPPALSTTDLAAVPDLYEELHPGVASVAIYRACFPYSQTSAQLTRLNGMLAEATQIAQAVGRENASLRVGNGSTDRAVRTERMWV